MKYVLLLILVTISTLCIGQERKYLVEIDLNMAQDDKLPVVIYPPKTDAEYVEYHMPKIVPGTYSISDFGRFVSDFKAFDMDGNELEIDRTSTNIWSIANEGELHRITYWVDDTWDATENYKSKKDNIVFEPGGTGINAEDSLFMINTFGFIGYLNNHKFLPYELSIKHTQELFGATALKKEVKSPELDVFYADDYNFLADGPIMYSIPDTTTRQIANAEIIVSVFSPNKKLTSTEVMDNIEDLMIAQSKYLGGSLPVDRYAYLIYLYDYYPISGATGALEHSYSSVYSLGERNADRIAKKVRDVAAHEFLHIVTPLNIHSKEIGEFDYINPKMSKHLWLYEGVTEYGSIHVQVKHDLFSKEMFLDEILTKIKTASNFPEISFTEMSEKILEPAYEDMYRNVYEKGALIGLCLDLYIIKYSNGEKNLQWLMQELSKKYGKETSFEDDELFDVITQMTSPEIGTFLNTHVAGNEPLPLQEVLEWAGIDYAAEKRTTQISLGRFGLGLNDDKELIIDDVSNLNSFGKEMGLKVGDVLMELNGQEFTLMTAKQVMADTRANVKEGETITMLVGREKRGKIKPKKLKAKAIEVPVIQKNFIEFVSEPSEEQQKIRNLWLEE
ncbi:MAG: PDZ domain-containing protein [Cyclobacteriaceae bacterium]